MKHPSPKTAEENRAHDLHSQPMISSEAQRVSEDGKREIGRIIMFVIFSYSKSSSGKYPFWGGIEWLKLNLGLT